MAVVGWDTMETKMTGYRDVPYAYVATGSFWYPLIVTTRAPQGRPIDQMASMIAMPAVRFAVPDGIVDVRRAPAQATPQENTSAQDRVVVSDVNAVEGATDEALETTARLSFAREWLSLNISQLAAVLGVTRPTVYDWLSGERSPHADNALRIKQIYDLAREWEAASGVPLSTLATTPIVDNQSLVSALSGDAPNLTLAREILARCTDGVVPSASENLDRALRREALDDAERMARWIR
jgi:DNA-binding transcriptional regulator YiaG